MIVYIHYDRANRLQLEIGDSFENNYIALPGYFYEFLSWNENLPWLKSYLYDKAQQPISNLKLRIEELESSYFGDINRIKLYKDIIFEQIRRERYNDKPSRIYSIFFSEIEQKEVWEEQLLKDFKNDSIQYIFEISEAIKFHKSYTYYLEQITSLDRYDEIETNAILYWEGVIPNDKPEGLSEYLFVGKAKVIDKILIAPN